MEHVPDLLAVEHQDALEQDHICRVHHCGLWEPARRQQEWAQALRPGREQITVGEGGPQKPVGWGGLGGGPVSPGGEVPAAPSPSPPRSQVLTVSGSQNHTLGPRQFCPPQCFSESCASDRYQKRLQGWNKRQTIQVPLPRVSQPALGPGGTSDPVGHVDWELPLLFRFAEPSAVS